MKGMYDAIRAETAMLVEVGRCKTRCERGHKYVHQRAHWTAASLLGSEWVLVNHAVDAHEECGPRDESDKLSIRSENSSGAGVCKRRTRVTSPISSYHDQSRNEHDLGKGRRGEVSVGFSWKKKRCSVTHQKLRDCLEKESTGKAILRLIFHKTGVGRTSTFRSPSLREGELGFSRRVSGVVTCTGHDAQELFRML